MQRVKAIGVLSMAKISGLCYGALGLCFAPFFILFSAIGSIAAKQSGASPFPAFLGVGFAISAPFIYGAMGFVMGALGALVYNLIAGWIGGLEIELQPVTPDPSSLLAQNP